MEEFLENTRSFLNSGDPEISSFFLVRHNYLPFILCACYIMFSTVTGPAIMKNRKPFGLRNVLIVFNFFMVVSYATIITKYFLILPKLGDLDFCKKAVVKKDTPVYEMARIFWWMYMLKYLQFFDTVFFILRKKENLVTFLHVFHHTFVPVVSWIFLRTETNGMHSVPAIMNGSVHVVMYTYYGLAAMGPKIQKYLWWKKYLTQLQMIQFVLIVVFESFIGPISGCSMSTFGRTVSILFGPFFFILFYQFYRTAFSKNSTLAGKSAATNGTVRTSSEKIYANGVTNGGMKKE